MRVCLLLGWNVLSDVCVVCPSLVCPSPDDAVVRPAPKGVGIYSWVWKYVSIMVLPTIRLQDTLSANKKALKAKKDSADSLRSVVCWWKCKFCDKTKGYYKNDPVNVDVWRHLKQAGHSDPSLMADLAAHNVKKLAPTSRPDDDGAGGGDAAPMQRPHQKAGLMDSYVQRSNFRTAAAVEQWHLAMFDFFIENNISWNAATSQSYKTLALAADPSGTLMGKLRSKTFFTDTALPATMGLHDSTVQHVLEKRPFCLTMDGWTSKRQARLYISVVATTLAEEDDGLRVVRHMIGFERPMYVKKGAKEQALMVRRCLERVNLCPRIGDDEDPKLPSDLQSRIVCLMSDNARDAKKCAANLEVEHWVRIMVYVVYRFRISWPHPAFILSFHHLQGCLAHTVNLAFKDAAADMDFILKPFKEVVAKCTNSAKRNLILGAAASSVRKHTQSSDDLRPEMTEDELLDLVMEDLQDAILAGRNKAIDPALVDMIRLRSIPETRFIYAADMLRTCIKNRAAVNATLKAQDEDVLTEVQWARGEKLFEFLDQVQSAIRMMEGSSSPSLAASVIAYARIDAAVEAVSKDTSLAGKAVDRALKNFKTGLEQRVAAFPESRLEAESAAVLLDPEMYALYLDEVDDPDAELADGDSDSGSEDGPDEDLEGIPESLHGGIDYLTRICKSELGALFPDKADSEDGADEDGPSNPYRRSSKSPKKRRVMDKKPKHIRDLVVKNLNALHEDWARQVDEVRDEHGELTGYKPKDNLTILKYWNKRQRGAFPYLSPALKYLVPCPATNTACESSFSTSSNIVGDRGGQMADSTVRGRTTLKYDKLRVCEANTAPALKRMIKQAEDAARKAGEREVVDVEADGGD